MIPVLFEIGPFKIYSYGLMLGIAFLLGSYILSLELKRKNLNPNIASTVTLLAVIFGIAGAKLLFLFENWTAFTRDPFGMAFSAGGLTWYGGFIVGITAIYIYIRRKRVPFLRFLDALGIALILGYGVGRIGCHLSGDGDYGYPTTLPWGTIYAQGISKPSEAAEGYFRRHPEEATFWHYDSLRAIPAGIDRQGRPYNEFDATIPMHPAPIYEFILGVIGFLILWSLRKRISPDGKLFMIYLMLASVFRFSVEFVRLNPHLLFGLSEAQLIAIVLFIVGSGGYVILGKKGQRTQDASR